jgi:hypothetical protein
MLASCSTNRFEVKFEVEYKLDKLNYADYQINLDTLIIAHLTYVHITTNNQIFFEVEFEFKDDKIFYISTHPFVINPEHFKYSQQEHRTAFRSTHLKYFQLIEPNKKYVGAYSFMLSEPIDDTTQVSLIFRTASGIFDKNKQNVYPSEKGIVLHTFKIKDYK